MILVPNVAQSLRVNDEYARYAYETLFPISKLSSSIALSGFVQSNDNPQNEILSVISEECAINILKKTFALP